MHVCASAGRVNEIIDGPTQDSSARKDDKRSLTIDRRIYLCNLGARSHVASSHDSRNLVSVLTRTTNIHTDTNTQTRTWHKHILPMLPT